MPADQCKSNKMVKQHIPTASMNIIYNIAQHSTAQHSTAKSVNQSCAQMHFSAGLLKSTQQQARMRSDLPCGCPPDLPSPFVKWPAEPAASSSPSSPPSSPCCTLQRGPPGTSAKPASSCLKLSSCKICTMPERERERELHALASQQV